MNYPCARKALGLFRKLITQYEGATARDEIDALSVECDMPIHAPDLEVKIRELEVEVSHILYWFRAASQYVAK